MKITEKGCGRHGLKTNRKKTVLLRFTRDGDLDIHQQGKIYCFFMSGSTAVDDGDLAVEVVRRMDKLGCVSGV